MITIKTLIIIKQFKPKNMKTLDVINFITSNPEYTNIVVMDMDDREPIQAIEFLSSCDQVTENSWYINGSLLKNTLLIYSNY